MEVLMLIGLIQNTKSLSNDIAAGAVVVLGDKDAATINFPTNSVA